MGGKQVPPTNLHVSNTAENLTKRQVTHTLQGTSRTSSTNPSKSMKQMDAKAALYSTSHCMNERVLQVENTHTTQFGIAVFILVLY